MAGGGSREPKLGAWLFRIRTESRCSLRWVGVVWGGRMVRAPQQGMGATLSRGACVGKEAGTVAGAGSGHERRRAGGNDEDGAVLRGVESTEAC